MRDDALFQIVLFVFVYNIVIFNTAQTVIVGKCVIELKIYCDEQFWLAFWPLAIHYTIIFTSQLHLICFV